MWCNYMFYASTYKKGVEIISKFPYKVGIVAFMVFPELLKTDEINFFP